MTASPLLQITGLSLHQPAATAGGPPLAVLDGLDLELAAGEAVAVLGPSGAGKSTLLHLVAGLLPPTAGRIVLDGQDLAAATADQLARLRNRTLGLVFQDHHLLPQLTALENVLLPTLAFADAGAATPARARELLHRVGLGDRLDHRPAQLSGGERQRVAVARALVLGPRLLLADEPTGSLDAAAAAAVGELLRELQREAGAALLVVTHSQALAARADRVLELRHGRLHGRGAGA